MVKTVFLDEAARLLGVSRRTVYYRIREGKLRTIRTACRTQRVVVDSIEALLRAEHRLPDGHAEPVHGECGYGIAPHELRIVDVVDGALVREGVHHDTAGDLELGAALRLDGARGLLVQLLLEDFDRGFERAKPGEQ